MTGISTTTPLYQTFSTTEKGYQLTIQQFNKSERTVLTRLEYRLNWYSVFHCAELLIERLHHEHNYVCTNPRLVQKVEKTLKNQISMVLCRANDRGLHDKQNRFAQNPE